MIRINQLAVAVVLTIGAQLAVAQEDFGGFEEVLGIDGVEQPPADTDAGTPVATPSGGQGLTEAQRQQLLQQRQRSMAALEEALSAGAPQALQAPAAGGRDEPDADAPVVATEPEVAPASAASRLEEEERNRGGSKIIQVSSGKNVILPISLGQLNRIITPFESPIIASTVDPTYVTIQKTKNVISFGTTLRKPIGVFITPEEDPETAISLTLVPVDRVQPQQVIIELEGYLPAPKVTEAVSEPEFSRVSHSYLDWVNDLALTLAKGSTPQGFSLGTPSVSDACGMPGLRLTAAQALTGARHRIVVYRAENISANAQMIQEQYCWKPEVNFVLAWEKITLQPGEASEVFVIEQVTSEPINRRPSTLSLGGGQQ